MSSKKYLFDFSIVVCVYNPEERIFGRCLESIAKLDKTGLSVEVLVADNNSRVAVAGLPYVQRFVAGNGSAHSEVVVVKQQGVKYARMAAIEKARGRFIVYIDSDNEPAPDYLQELILLNQRYPLVGAWGPGKVSVDFPDGIDKSIEPLARVAFQERNEKNIRYDSSGEWQSCYPYGTGLCTYSFLLKDYLVEAKKGVFTMEGRKGSALSSGEDTQMILFSIKKGYKAGVSPTLQLTHIIPRSRANLTYLNRLAFGTGICYETCRIQVFPELEASIRKDMIRPSVFSRRVLKRLFRLAFRDDPKKILETVQYIAVEGGKYEALGRPLPFWVKKVIKLLKLN